MNRKPIFHLSLFIGLIVFSLSYCGIKQFHIPLPRYYPTLKQWSMVENANEPSMGWYAQTLASLLAGGVSGAVAYLIGLLYGTAGERAVVVVGWIAVAAVVLAMVYIFQHEWRNWILSHHEVTAAISGSDTIEQLDNNIGRVGWRLDASMREKLDAVSESFR